MVVLLSQSHAQHCVQGVYQAAGNSSRREATSGASLHTEATEEIVGENLGGARGSKEGP